MAYATTPLFGLAKQEGWTVVLESGHIYELGPSSVRGSMSAPRWAAIVVTWLFLLVGGLVFGCVSASAERGHVFGGSFGKAGSISGDFTEPAGVAVNESTGDIYVVDKGNDRVEWFSSTGSFRGQFNGGGMFEVGNKFEIGTPAPGGQFSPPGAIAVDNSCRYKKLEGSACTDAFPSNGDVYVVDNGQSAGKKKAIDKFTPDGKYIGQLTEIPAHEEEGTDHKIVDIPAEPFGLLIYGIAVDSKGDLWVDYNSGNDFLVQHVASFTGGVPNQLIRVLAAELPFEERGFFEQGLAVDSEDNLYIKGDFANGGFTKSVEKVNNSGEILNKEVGSVSSEWVAVESSNESPSNGNVYLGNQTAVDRVSSAGEPVEQLSTEHLVRASGIAVNASSTSETVYVADSSSDNVDIFLPEPPGPPTVGEEVTSQINAEEATFTGKINPRGASTEYHFEYGRCLTLAECATSNYEHSIPLPDVSLAASFTVSTVSAKIGGLQPDLPYHFRLVARNEHDDNNPVDGEERTFVTQNSGSPLVLADSRAWELVSPVDKHGGLIFELGDAQGGVSQASTDGKGITYLITVPPEDNPPGSSGLGQVTSTRSVDGGWTSVDVAMPHSTPAGVSIGNGYELRAVSGDLSIGITESLGVFSPPEIEHEGKDLSVAFPEATDRTAYRRNNSTCDSEPMTCFTPLVTGAAEGGDVSSKTKFGGSSNEPVGAARFIDAAPNENNVILRSSVALTETSAPNGGLYEWSVTQNPSDRLQLVSVLPASEGGKAVTGELGSTLAGNGLFARHAISDDGLRVFFTSGGHLYMRDTGKSETIALDVGESGSGGGFFQTASTDGSTVFFTDMPLTKNSGIGGQDLYRCQIVEEEVAAKSVLTCDLADLTQVPSVGEPGAGESASVQGGVLGASEDGKYVYYVADGVQAAGAKRGDCKGEGESLSPGETCNLYVNHDGVTSFIATLSGDDSPDWIRQLRFMTSRVSPNGGWLTFMSDRSLTGYDNRDVVSGKPDEEVYLYNAVANRLVCVSCDPSGAQPVGVNVGVTGTKSNVRTLADTGAWSGRWVAGNIPGWTPYDLENAVYQSRFLSDTGRVFFNSSDALVPQDSNGEEDVYEFEPMGVGDCSSGLKTYSEGAGGCVGLVSSGVAVGESGFLDASVTGGDVFFLTLGQLTSGDVDTALDVYDAHECTTDASCPPRGELEAPECKSAGACRASSEGQPPIYGAPSSATLVGMGNVGTAPRGISTSPVLTRGQRLTEALRACRTHNVKRKSAKKKRAVCERAARNRYGPKKSSKTRVKKSSVSGRRLG